MSANAKQTVTGRPIATLDLPIVVSALINLVGAVVAALTNNPHFPNPTPSLTVLKAALAALVTAENNALTRVKGAVVQRNAAKKALVQLLQLLKANVQSTADADPESSLLIIEGSGLTVRKTPVRQPRVFAATAGATSGTVKLVAASAGKRASYEWQYSADAGKTWVAAPPSIQAKTVIPGLPAGTSVQFRYRAVTPKTGAEDWSAPLTMMVK